MKRKGKIIVAVLIALIVVGVVLRASSDSLALFLAGYRNPITIEEGFEFVSGTTHWRAILAEKDGVKRLAMMDQGFLGFWGLPQTASQLGGDYQGLEYLDILTVPPCSGFYGYDYTTLADGDHTESYKYVRRHISRVDWFYHGSNAVMTLVVPEDALPKDSALQIYQAGPEYVLHLVMYPKPKDSGSYDGGFATLYQALLDNGCIE